jgi:tripeptidyl-peptidase I
VDDLNPFDPENEGFLSWLTFVGNQASPPLVQSLSYGDVEASIFTPDNQDAYDYGTRCDEEFMQLGLRGVTILVASGDDGLGGTQLRDDYELACSQGRCSPLADVYTT